MKIFDGYKNKKLYVRLIAASFLLYVMTICIKMGYSSQLAAIIDDYGAIMNIKVYESDEIAAPYESCEEDGS